MDDYMTPCELAKLTGQRPQAIYNLIRQGYVKTETIEVVVTKTVIKKSDADDYVARRNARASRNA